jgi:hypothetical protein
MFNFGRPTNEKAMLNQSPALLSDELAYLTASDSITNRVVNDHRFDQRRDLVLESRRAAGERGRIVSAFASNAGLARLVEVQYVTKQPQSERKTLYLITNRGRQALARMHRNR